MDYTFQLSTSSIHIKCKDSVRLEIDTDHCYTSDLDSHICFSLKIRFEHSHYRPYNLQHINLKLAFPDAYRVLLKVDRDGEYRVNLSYSQSVAQYLQEGNQFTTTAFSQSHMTFFTNSSLDDKKNFDGWNILRYTSTDSSQITYTIPAGSVFTNTVLMSEFRFISVSTMPGISRRLE